MTAVPAVSADAAPLAPLTLAPLNQAGEELLRRRESVLFGVSPFNSAYTAGSVRRIFRWAAPRFASVHMLTAGYEAAYRLIDQGVAPRAAVRRAARVVGGLRNAAVSALRGAGYPDPVQHVHVWTKLEERPRYRELLAAGRAAYREGGVFTDACREETVRACGTWLGRVATTAEIEHNVAYILAEVPLLVDSPAVLGVPTSVFAYHHTPPLVAMLLSGLAPTLRPVPGQGFAVLTTTDGSPP